MSSPEAEEGRERKRHRKIWSCGICRKRKLQCDRQWPTCSRCAKNGQAEKCFYFDDSAIARTQRSSKVRDSLPTPQSVVSQSKLSTNETPQDGVKFIRSPAEASSEKHQKVLTAESKSRKPFTNTGEVQLRGQQFHTRCNGCTNCGSLISLIPGLSEFAQDAFNGDASLRQLRQKLKDLAPEENLSFSPPAAAESENLKTLLPTRSESDRLIQLYLNSFDYIYPVLHLPDFQKDYAGLWLNMPDIHPEFVLLVLIIIAIALCLDKSSAEANRYSTTSLIREEVDGILDAVEAWLQRRIQKFEKLIDFQISFLLLLARQVRGQLYKRTYANAGRLIREFMCSGLHRKPSNLAPDSSTNDHELRRRLWLAAVEFELQAAFESGMPPSNWTEQSNILDFDEAAANAGKQSRQRSVISQSSYLDIASESIILRHSLNTVLNNVRKEISFEESKQCTEAINRHIEKIPRSMDSKGQIVSSLLLINLHQYLLALHERQIREAISTFEKAISRSVLLESATKMIDAHKAVVDNGTYVIELLYEDHIRAALSICHVYMNTNPRSDGLLVQATNSHALLIMDQALSLLKTKVRQFSFHHRQLWNTIAAGWLMKAHSEPDARERFTQGAADEYKSLFDQDSRGGNGGLEPILPADAATNEVYDLSLLENEWILEQWAFEPWLLGPGRTDL